MLTNEKFPEKISVIHLDNTLFINLVFWKEPVLINLSIFRFWKFDIFEPLSQDLPFSSKSVLAKILWCFILFAGYYMYIEGSNQKIGTVARMVTPLYQDSTSVCLQFYYHMYGSGIGNFSIYILVRLFVWLHDISEFPAIQTSPPVY